MKHREQQQKVEDPGMYKFNRTNEERDVLQENAMKKIEKEASFVPGLNNFESSIENNPFQIKWEFYCQARNDWQHRLDKFLDEILGKSTSANFWAIQTISCSILFYCICGALTTVFMKFSLPLRYTLLLTSCLISYCAGCLWGYALGQRFLLKGAKTAPLRAAAGMVLACAASLWAAGFDYNIGYILMELTCAGTIASLYWLRHRHLVQSWNVKYFAPVLLGCIVAHWIVHYRAGFVKQDAAKSVDEADLADVLSLTSIALSIIPKWMKEILKFHDQEEEIVVDPMDEE